MRNCMLQPQSWDRWLLSLRHKKQECKSRLIYIGSMYYVSSNESSVFYFRVWFFCLNPSHLIFYIFILQLIFLVWLEITSLFVQYRNVWICYFNLIRFWFRPFMIFPVTLNCPLQSNIQLVWESFPEPIHFLFLHSCIF